uniref:DUF3750 domain-containing protein n=1 Tax=Pararhizobium sp. IMCC3301 TaxID=3067904 RepID=UPI002740ED83|nr:DUF3750 domain-containing protein [Pararhizobium sp. IMCC3301]
MLKFLGNSTKYLSLFFAFLFLLPLSVHGAVFWSKGWETSWRNADWSSAAILPNANESPEATISVYAARTGRWKGIFAVHSWIVVKDRDARSWERYEVVGWGAPIRKNAYAADARWYGNEPMLVGTISGDEAEALIPKVRAAVARYPYGARGDYSIWPGPNSNTFVATILRETPELNLSLPPTAVGKDYLADGSWFTASENGLKFSVKGLFGFSIGGPEGLEVNILGLVAGIDWQHPALKLPGFGRLGV